MVGQIAQGEIEEPRGGVPERTAGELSARTMRLSMRRFTGSSLPLRKRDAVEFQTDALPARAISVDFRQLRYDAGMASKVAAKRRRTTMVPVTTMEEAPVLSAEESDDLRASLEQAERRLEAGKGIDYDPNAFKQRLTDIYRKR